MGEPIRLLGWTQLQWDHLFDRYQVDGFLIHGALDNERLRDLALRIRKDYLRRGGPPAGPDTVRCLLDRYGPVANPLLIELDKMLRAGRWGEAMVKLAETLHAAESGILKATATAQVAHAT